MLKAYKYRLYPNKVQRELLEKHFGCCRFIYNWGLDAKKKAYKETGKSLPINDLIKKIPELKKELEWLKEVNAQSLQSALRNLDSAYSKFFKKQGKFPRFKNKFSKQSFQCPQNVTVDFENNMINIPKIKGIKIKLHRIFIGKIKTVTISKTKTDEYYASILIDNDEPLPIPVKPQKELSIGVDVGIKSFAVLSNGEIVANPRYLIESEKRLKRAQRQLSRKKKGSANRNKARMKVAKLHEEVANQRKDFQHKISKSLIDNYDAIVLEDLSIINMVKNHHLAKHITDVGWGTFRTFCEYKAIWYGKNVKIIGRFEPSSKMCNICGFINKNLTLKDRIWTCQNCGTEHDRDINAAKNILNFGFIPTGSRDFKPVETVEDLTKEVINV